MHKGYGSCLVCESVCLCVCPSVCLSVTALAASAYVYTAKQHAQVHVRMIARLLFISFQHKLIHPGNYLYLAESELQWTSP